MEPKDELKNKELNFDFWEMARNTGGLNRLVLKGIFWPLLAIFGLFTNVDQADWLRQSFAAFYDVCWGFFAFSSYDGQVLSPAKFRYLAACNGHFSAPRTFPETA